MVIQAEELSAWMDDEGDAAQENELIRSWAQEDTARRWNAYHLIGDVLREQEIRHVCLAQRISQALEAEPVVLVPKRRQREVPPPTRWLAVAATVAAVSLTAWNLRQPLPDAPGRVAQSGLAVPSVASSHAATGVTALAQNNMHPVEAGGSEGKAQPPKESRAREASTVASVEHTAPIITPEPAPEVATQLASQAAEPYVALHRQWSTLSGFQTVDYETGPASGR